MIRAILFDCNGVISDDEPIHFRLLQKVIQEEGARLSRRDYYKHYLAFDDRSCFREILKANGQKAPPQRVRELIKRKAKYYEEVIKKELKIFPGVRAFVKKYQKKYVMGVVSGALRHEIDLILERAGIFSAYSVIVSTEDVKRGKPDPEGYLKGWNSLNQLPRFKKNPLKSEECLVIEDSIHGVDAALSAGMRCLAVTNSYPKKKLLHADAVVSTLEGVRLEQLGF